MSLQSVLAPQQRACPGDVCKPRENPDRSSDAALRLDPGYGSDIWVRTSTLNLPQRRENSGWGDLVWMFGHNTGTRAADGSRMSDYNSYEFRRAGRLKHNWLRGECGRSACSRQLRRIVHLFNSCRLHNAIRETQCNLWRTASHDIFGDIVSTV
ncbi:hypothetical protein PIB30_049306 [Stylosanthes scabra]|uniref:Reverse transcriptase zinc-binding domain-containing protein n=1 Tax=Stylosanthes scabra TaxID=79078 RepID=A0ABU6SI98_9FABA|nr:hypothetical protein [Stylosanthes scabra]